MLPLDLKLLLIQRKSKDHFKDFIIHYNGG